MTNRKYFPINMNYCASYFLILLCSEIFVESNKLYNILNVIRFYRMYILLNNVMKSIVSMCNLRQYVFLI